MKKIYKLILTTVFASTFLFNSCETLELEQLNNPNNLTSGDPTFLLNSIQEEYTNSQVDFNDISSELTRVDYMFGRNYFSNYSGSTFNDPWNDLYSTLLPDLALIESIDASDEDVDLRMHIAMAKIMQAHLMMQLVDFLGDIVSLEFATDPINYPIPPFTTDGGLTSYNEAVDVLDEAIGLLNQEPLSVGDVDLFYGGDASKWIKFANTLKMRAAKVSGDYSTFNAIAANPANYISSADDDMQFNYGLDQTPTDLRHQDYASDYTSSGANIYQNTWLMQTMINNNDPRVRYYFYRQSDCTPGASCDPEGDGQSLSCSLESAPPHLQGTDCESIWCHMEDGFWGRMHGNSEGTPPDNFLRTAVGVYPAAGKFDDDDFSGVGLGLGGGGAGIEPIILSSYVDFWKAEVAMAQGNPGDAAINIQSGLTASISKVQSFISVDSDADTSFEPSGEDVTAFIDQIVDDFATAFTDEDKWNILGEQYFIASYGGGSDCHNFYRRHGAPNTVCPNIDPSPGNYIRTFLYPSDEVSVNSNVEQRTNNDDAVFWNTQPLPSSN